MEKKRKKQFIWEYLLENNGEDIHFRQASSWNPYKEIVEETEDKECIFNALYRYENVFGSFFQSRGVPKTQKDMVLFDVCAHYLIQTDSTEGISIKEYKKRKCGWDIEQGMYGEKIKQYYEALNVQQKFLIMHYLEQQKSMMKSGVTPNGSMEIYKKVVIDLLNTGVLYRDCYHDATYILYVGEQKRRKTEQLIELAEILFLPLGYKVEVLWDKHFGVLGEDVTMKMGVVRMM